MHWATRAGCHVDRAACAWLIVRHIDREATFLCTQDEDPPDDATAFDMIGVERSRDGDDSTFETMLRVYELVTLSYGTSPGSFTKRISPTIATTPLKPLGSTLCVAA